MKQILPQKEAQFLSKQNQIGKEREKLNCRIFRKKVFSRSAGFPRPTVKKVCEKGN